MAAVQERSLGCARDDEAGERMGSQGWRAVFLEDGIPVSQPSPRGEGAPKGRIGHRRHEREWEGASQVDDLRKHPIHRSAVPLPRWGRLRGATLRVDFYKGRCPKVVTSHQPLKTTHPCFQATGFNGFRRFKGFRWRLRRILDDGIPISSAFPSRGRCHEGADRALAV